MAINELQKQLIIDLDFKVKKHFGSGGDEEGLLMLLPEFMTNDLKSLISSGEKDDINNYCQKYEGFYCLMKLLEQMALLISKGDFKF